MIPQNSTNENTLPEINIQFINAIRELKSVPCSNSLIFASNCHYNWRRFLLLLLWKAAAYFSTLTRLERVKCFVLDGSVIPRAKNKKVELLSFVHDHVIHKTVRGFNLLLLGWTDGYSFLPVAFNMLASANEQKRINPVNKSIDKRTNGAKVREGAVMN